MKEGEEGEDTPHETDMLDGLMGLLTTFLIILETNMTVLCGLRFIGISRSIRPFNVLVLSC